MYIIHFHTSHKNQFYDKNNIDCSTLLTAKSQKYHQMTLATLNLSCQNMFLAKSSIAFYKVNN